MVTLAASSLSFGYLRFMGESYGTVAKLLLLPLVVLVCCQFSFSFSYVRLGVPQYLVHGERECCLLVLNSVTSTPQWIRVWYGRLEFVRRNDVKLRVLKSNDVKLRALKPQYRCPQKQKGGIASLLVCWLLPVRP
jgi:hypothetical protein